MLRKIKKYAKLKGKMCEEDMKQAEICQKLGKSQTWMTNRLTGVGCFTVDDGYRILDILRVPHSEFTEYFPPGGYC